MAPKRIAALFQISSQQVRAAIDYIEEHKEEVMAEYARILGRCARGNPPELQAKLDASHKKFMELMEQVRKAKARGETDIQGMIRRFRESRAKEGNSDAGNHGRQ